jgi:hypothetical protein
MSRSEVNDDDGSVEESSEKDNKQNALGLKFYYAGGSCRFMFQYPTKQERRNLKAAVESAANKPDLV